MNILLEIVECRSDLVVKTQLGEDEIMIVGIYLIILYLALLLLSATIIISFINSDDAYAYFLGTWTPIGHGHSKQIVQVMAGPERTPVVFSINSENNGTYYKYQFANNGTWSDWISLRGSSKQIAAVTTGPERTPVLFSIGLYDNNLYFKQQFRSNNWWSDWISLGGSSKQIAAVTNPISNRPVVFSLDSRNNGTYYKHQFTSNGSWSDWISLGGSSKQISPAFDIKNDLIVYSIGLNNDNIYYKSQSVNNGTWSDWISLGGSSKQIAAVTSNGTYSPIVLSVSPDTAVYLRYHTYNANETGWIPLGGASRGIAATSTTNGILQLFSIGNKTEEVFYYSINDLPVVNDLNLKVEKIFDGNLSSISTAATGIAFIDKNTILLLQKDDGKVRLVSNGVMQNESMLDFNVNSIGERGLLGIVTKNMTTSDLLLRSDKNSTKFVFFYVTEAAADGAEPIGNRIYRYEWNGSNLIHPKLILTLPSTFINHNAGKLTIGLDGSLYTVIGDQNQTGFFQNFKNSNYTNTGVILGMTSNGEPFLDNPFYNLRMDNMTNKVFAYGIRNSFGIAIDPETGKLWDTENGDTTYDEINLVFPGFNSGWRKVMGPMDRTGFTTDDLVRLKNSEYADPVISWRNTIGITDIEFFNSSKLGNKYNNNIFVGDINKGNLYFFMLNNDRNAFVTNGTSLLDLVIEGTTKLDNIMFGRGFAGITDLQTGLDGLLYILSIDGRIFRIAPQIGN